MPAAFITWRVRRTHEANSQKGVGNSEKQRERWMRRILGNARRVIRDLSSVIAYSRTCMCGGRRKLILV